MAERSEKMIESEVADMDFRLNEDQLSIQELARQLAQEVCLPEAELLDREHIFPEETWKQIAEAGLIAVNHEERFGGIGKDKIAEVLVIEELSKASLTHGATYALLGHGFSSFIEKYGTEEQKEKYIPRVVGEGYKGAFCMSEPGAGSDAMAVRTTAVRDGDDFVISGSKCFVTAGNIAQSHIIVAKDPELGERAFTGFIIDDAFKLEGFSCGRVEDKMGLRGLPTSELYLDNVRVPADCVLGGKEGEGKMMHYALGTLDGARIGTGAQALGVMEAAYELALKYSGERVQFGKPINANQGIKWYLAEMASKIEMARLLVYQAAWLETQGLPHTKEAAMAKLYAPKFAREVVNDALQIYGGLGYMHEVPLERMYRDIKITEIYEGSSEIMKVVIANSILKGKR